MQGYARVESRCAKHIAFVAGGETIMHLTGTGKGGRNGDLDFAEGGIIGRKESDPEKRKGNSK